ncbi:CoA-dependent acyltransferase [Mycena galericulata]|nr:CoA-dependent acyltransferase [Mycena galericulata]
MFLRSLRYPRNHPILLGLTRFGCALHTSARSLAPRPTTLHTFKLADIGEGITECEVLRWAVTPSSPSARVAQFDLLCEVQSDKASVELTSPFDGLVKELLVKEGEVARVGAGLCVIEVEREVGAEEASTSTEGKEEPASPPPTATQEATMHEERTTAPPPSPSPPPTSSPPPSSATARTKPPGPHPLDPSAPPLLMPTLTHALATPAVRHHARTHGVDLAALAPGSGRGGRVERADVDAFLAAQSQSEAGGSGGGGVETRGEEVVVELGRTRAAMWRAMEKSLAIPHFGYSATLDITALHALLPTLNAHIPARYQPASSSSVSTAPRWNPAEALGAGIGVAQETEVPDAARYARLTYLPFLVKALSRAMMEWPLFRASITASSSAPGPESLSGSAAAPSKPTLTIRPHADIALALATPTGLYAPVLRAVNAHSLFSLASEIASLSSLGRAVSTGGASSGLQKSHFAGGATLTVSNVGAAGRGTGAAPVLVPGGGVAIVALGRAEWVWDVRVGAGGMRGARRLHLPISWAADHRVVEGAELAAFVECWRGWVESPGRMVGEGV